MVRNMVKPAKNTICLWYNGDAEDAADALGEGRSALVSAKQDAALRAALSARSVKAEPVGEVKGYDYSDGRKTDLEVWRRDQPPSPDADGSADPPAPPTGR